MLVKLSSKNQVTLPKRLIDSLAPFEYLEIEVLGAQIVLTPVRVQRADAVRKKLLDLGIGESSIADAVKWARRRSDKNPCIG